MASSKTLDEQHLVRRCVHGDATAWEHLYQRFSRPLAASIRLAARYNSVDPHLVDEIAARVWFALAGNKSHLLREFDPGRGSLSSYLAVIARNELRSFFRSETRNRKRERAVSRPESAPVEMTPELMDRTIRQFVVNLTPAERDFCRHVLLGLNGTDRHQQYTATNRWQLRHRIRQKLHLYVDEEVV